MTASLKHTIHKLVYKNNGIPVRVGDEVVVNDVPCRVCNYLLQDIEVIDCDTGQGKYVTPKDIGAEWV